jgi:hypothetical protein
VLAAGGVEPAVEGDVERVELLPAIGPAPAPGAGGIQAAGHQVGHRAVPSVRGDTTVSLTSRSPPSLPLLGERRRRSRCLTGSDSPCSVGRAPDALWSRFLGQPGRRNPAPPRPGGGTLAGWTGSTRFRGTGAGRFPDVAAHNERAGPSRGPAPRSVVSLGLRSRLACRRFGDVVEERLLGRRSSSLGLRSSRSPPGGTEAGGLATMSRQPSGYLVRQRWKLPSLQGYVYTSSLVLLSRHRPVATFRS